MREADKSVVNGNYIDYTSPAMRVCHTSCTSENVGKNDTEKKLYKCPGYIVATMFPCHKVTCLRKTETKKEKIIEERQIHIASVKHDIELLTSFYGTMFQARIDNNIILLSSDLNTRQIYDMIPYLQR